MSSEEYAPKSVIYRTADFTQHISASMGVIDHGTYFDNEMSKDKFIIKFVREVKQAIDKNVCKVPKDFVFPDEQADNLDKIWNGTCFYGIRQNPFVRKFLYSFPDEPYDEIIPLPKFRNLIPNQKVVEDTMLIQIRESMPLKYAFQGSDYRSLIQDAGMQHLDGTPKFSHEDVNSLTIKSYFITRQVFNSLIEDFEYFFNTNWNVISVEFQKIIDFAGMGDMGDDEDGSGDFVTGVD